MQQRLSKMYRGVLVMLLLITAWSVWRAAAQTAPGVELSEPAENSRFDPGDNIVISANVDTGLGKPQRVEFLRSGSVLGVISNAPYSMVWSNTLRGTYTLQARAIIESNTVVESQVVHVRIYNAMLTFWLDHVQFLERHQLFGIPLWQYCAALIYIFLAFYFSKILDFLTRVWLKRWAEKTKTKLDDLMLELLNGPLRIISFIIFLRIGVEIFSWPDLVQAWLSKLFTIVVAATITYTALKVVDLLISYLRLRTHSETDHAFNQQLFPIVSKSLKVFVIVVATLITLDNIGVNITAAIASLSIGGLAVGLAAQDTLANLFGAVAIFADKPFRLGDRIQLDNVDGTVETIGLRSTRVRNLDGHLITVPNKTMGNATIINITRRPNIKTLMNISVTYDTPVEKVRQALALLEEIYRAHPKTADLIISFNKFADSSLNILVVHWWNLTDYKEYLAGMQELNLKIKERFDAEGISFAFPTQTVYLKQDSEWRLGGEPKN